MRLILSFLVLLITTPVTAEDSRVSVVGLATTSMEFAWDVKALEAGWRGKLDCQSFFHFFSLTDGKHELMQYLDAQECDDWHDLLQNASAQSPVCVAAGINVGIKRIECLTKPRN